MTTMEYKIIRKNVMRPRTIINSSFPLTALQNGENFRSVMVVLRKQVILLKTQNEESIDKYEKHLRGHGIEVNLIKTLIFDFQNIDILAEKLSRSNDYSGIIFSSPRCVSALVLACKDYNTNISTWLSKKNFAVGEATACQAYENLNLKCTGQDSGSAINLAKYIIKDKLDYKKPFLYPHGSLKSDNLTKELEKEGIKLDGILVYDTKENTNIEQEIKEVTNNYMDITEFIVFFSPSGLHSSLKYLKNVSDFLNVKLIAIGPTTEAAIKQEGLSVYGVAKQPTPQNVLEIILNY